MNPWRTPQRVVAADCPDQIADVGRDRGPADTTARLATPIQTEPAPMPAHQRLGLEDNRGFAHRREQPIEPDEETGADSRAYCISHLARRSPSALRSDGIIGRHGLLGRQDPTLFRRRSCEKVAPAGQFETGGRLPVTCPSMTDGLSTLYQDLLGGSYDCVDRIVLNAYFRTGHDPGGFRLWWRALTGSDETLENAYLMRLAGRFSRRVRGYARAHGIPVIDCPAGQRKHDLAEEYLAKTKITHGLFLVLVARARAPVWDVSANHHIQRKQPIPFVNHYSFHILDRDWGHLTIKISGHPPFPAR